jgi:hypothetical protein
MTPSHRFIDPYSSNRRDKKRRAERLKARHSHRIEETSSMRSKKTFEAVVEEQTAKPAYDGEVIEQLSPAEIEQREAQRDALLAGLHVPTQVATPKPVEPTVEVEAAVAAEVIPVEASEIEAAKVEIERIKQEHDEQTRTAQLVFQTRMTEAMQRLGELETRAAQALDAATADRLRDALASMEDDEIGNAVRSARADAATERQERLRQRVAPVLAQAAQTRALLRAFDRTFGAMLDKLRGTSREAFLTGTPTEAPHAHAAHACYSNIVNGLAQIDKVRESLEETLRTDTVRFDQQELVAGFELEVRQLIDRAAKGWRPEDERSLVWALTRLQTANPDAITHLQLVVRGVTGSVARLNSMKNSANVERVSYIIPTLPEKPMSMRIADGETPAVMTGGVFERGGN